MITAVGMGVAEGSGLFVKLGTSEGCIVDVAAGIIKAICASVGTFEAVGSITL